MTNLIPQVEEMKDLQRNVHHDNEPEEIGQLGKVLIFIALLGVVGAILYVAGFV